MSSCQSAEVESCGPCELDNVSLPTPWEIVQRVALRCPPLWSLRDIVAVNPYLGYTACPIEEADTLMKLRSLGRAQPSLSVLADLFERGYFTGDDVEHVIGVRGDRCKYTVSDVLSALRHAGERRSADAVALNPTVSSLAAWLDSREERSSQWLNGIIVDIGRFASQRYDRGISQFGQPNEGGFYSTWREYASCSFAMHARGVAHFHRFVASLPVDPDQALQFLIAQLGVVTTERLEDYLSALLGEVSGWAGYLRKLAWDRNQSDVGEVPEILVVRLAYDVALSVRSGRKDEFFRYVSEVTRVEEASAPGQLQQIEMIALEALERGYQRELFERQLRPVGGSAPKERASAQVVLCIDVRSEVLRRHLLKQNPSIEVYGFAGFFGLPIAVPGEDGEPRAQCPVLLSPVLSAEQDGSAVSKRWNAGVRAAHWWKQLTKFLSSGAPSCFTYVETFGFLSLFRMLFGRGRALSEGHGISSPYRIQSDDSTRIQLAEGVLKNLSLNGPYARLVVFCGHESTSANNPLEASLQCGACAGHSGAPNASAAAELLNDPVVRSGLAQRGWTIPEDTVFVAAVHNTTTDEVTILDPLPPSHQTDLSNLHTHLRLASSASRSERMLGHRLRDGNINDTTHRLRDRSTDISEIRPEWGLAGNASFIVAPSNAVRAADFEGRSFLHHYDESRDPSSSVLETILTAPVVVASWINLQYYGSSIDPYRLGSGLKTLHNISAGVGVTCGNDGDLAIGLAVQSLHDGHSLRHVPSRLHVIVAASKEQIDQIISKHKLLSDLVSNGWILLFSADRSLTQIHQRVRSGDWRLYHLRNGNTGVSAAAGESGFDGSVG